MIFVHLVALFLYPSLSSSVPSPMFQPSISSLPVFFALSSFISAVFDSTSIQSVSLSWRPVKGSCKPSHQSNQATKLRTAVSVFFLLHVRLWFNSARKTKVSNWKLLCLQTILSNADTLTRRRPGRRFIKLVTSVQLVTHFRVRTLKWTSEKYLFFSPHNF
jgi:hypothetical protein